MRRKIAEISLLPKVRYLKSMHTSINFCSVCMHNFRNANCKITYLPCDARHYFHAKCIKSWLLSRADPICPRCQVPVDFLKSIGYD